MNVKVARGEQEEEQAQQMGSYQDGGRRINLFSHFTIIKQYRPSMGKVVEANTILRSWGSKKPLDVKDMFTTELVTRKGAKKKTGIYMAAGHRKEPPLKIQMWRTRDLSPSTLKRGN